MSNLLTIIDKQPALIGVLVDYYFENGTSNSQTISRSSSYLSPRDAYDYDSISSNSRTTILDLICKIPDDLVTVNLHLKLPLRRV